MSPGKGYFSKAAVGFPSSVPLRIWGAKPGAWKAQVDDPSEILGTTCCPFPAFW